MEYKTLRKNRHTDADTGFRLRHVKSETEYFRPHDHDYYELFLVLRGGAMHIVGGAEIHVGAGDLIFIRKTDIHDYASIERGGFEFLNLAFTEENLFAVLDFLDCREDATQLLSSATPPLVHLTDSEKEAVHLKLASLLPLGDENPKRRRARARRILADIFADRLLPSERNDSAAPPWLKLAYEKMRSPKNFLLGTSRFFELCGRTREHTTRLLSAHYGLTPSDYLAELKLGYAAGLLRNSNLTVSEICYQSGFNNLSYFYLRFRKKFGVSPRSYREK